MLSSEFILSSCLSKNKLYVKPYILQKYNVSVEQLYIIVYGIKKCKYCGNTAMFKNWNKGFKETCGCKECIKKHRLEKRKETNLKKYGYEFPQQDPTFIKNVTEKTIKTCLEKYNVRSVLSLEHNIKKSQSAEATAKRKRTVKELYGVDDTFLIKDGRKRGLEKCNNDPKIIQKRKQTCIEHYGVDNPFKSSDFQEYLKDRLELKYGVRSSNHILEVHQKQKLKKVGSEEIKYRRHKLDENGRNSIQKQRETCIKRGIWLNRETLDYFNMYKREVVDITARQDLSKLKNIELRGINAYHLDHKFSIYEGFKQNIPPFIIGNICNLEMLHYKENISKKTACSISLEELLKAFYEK